MLTQHFTSNRTENDSFHNRMVDDVSQLTWLFTHPTDFSPIKECVRVVNSI